MPSRSSVVAAAVALAALLAARSASADGEPSGPPEETASPKFNPTGYVEVYYAYNFNRPSNAITNYRAFDSRHNTFTLSNVVLGGTFEAGRVGGKILFQVGNTPSQYYGSEPSLPGTGATNASNAALWKYIQEAYVTYKAPVGRGLTLQAGVFLSPIGIEVMPIKDDWNWSRSNLFFGFPYYHTGVRATYDWSPEWTTTVSAFNGWNSVVDNNDGKSIETDTTYRHGDDYDVRVLYFGGPERSPGAPEGPWFRHHFEASGTAQITSFFAVAGQADYGFEPNRIGAARWWAVAGMMRFRVLDPLYFAVRGDRFTEHLATDATRSSTPLFFGGSEWVTEGTATLDLRPFDHVSFRLEGRHDIAERPIYFRGAVAGDGSGATPFLPNARSQTTVTLGAVAWF